MIGHIRRHSGAMPGQGDLAAIPEAQETPCTYGMECTCEACTCRECYSRLESVDGNSTYCPTCEPELSSAMAWLEWHLPPSTDLAYQYDAREGAIVQSIIEKLKGLTP